MHTCRHGVNISIHAPRTGSDSCSRLQVRGSYNFNPRSPHGERQATIAQLDNKTAFQSTLPARGATIPYIDKLVNSKISIHAPRTGSDIINGLMARGGAISIHAPRTGSDCKSRSKRLSKRTFQSTLPARGATDPLTNVAISCGSISIHAPRTGSDRNTSHTISTQEHFNPRSPHGERLKYQRDVNIVIKFQSTLPARGATKARAQRWNRLVISIHAPRTGSDPSSATAAASACDFNPRSPHGERHTPF